MIDINSAIPGETYDVVVVDSKIFTWKIVEEGAEGLSVASVVHEDTEVGEMRAETDSGVVSAGVGVQLTTQAGPGVVHQVPEDTLVTAELDVQFCMSHGHLDLVLTILDWYLLTIVDRQAKQWGNVDGVRFWMSETHLNYLMIGQVDERCDELVSGLLW